MSTWPVAASNLAMGAQPGETVVDFGCGPGDVAIELARSVGADGFVHAIDLNCDLLDIARQRAQQERVADRIQFHHVTDESMPIDDESVDRVVFKSVLLYVPDLDATMAEGYRVLRPGGHIAAQDTDFWLSACTAFDRDEWREFLDAVRPAFADPTMGRNLRGALVRAGMGDVTTSVSAMVDDRGGFRGTLENFIGYARDVGTLSEDQLTDMARRADQAIAENTWLFVINFFQCNGTK
ncbi:MAG: class I SAM-dependent methyltransferase [Actinomycetota bacterium]|nr:class I SAM-dependent methyltransferase [Actinomycetota bacterium]